MSSFEDQLKQLRQAEIDIELAEKRLALQKDEEERRRQEEIARKRDEPYLTLESFITENITGFFERIKTLYCDNKAELKWKRQALHYYYDKKVKKEVKKIFWKETISEIEKTMVSEPAVTFVIVWDTWRTNEDYYSSWGGKILGVTVTSKELFLNSGASLNRNFESSSFKKSQAGEIISKKDSDWRQKLEQVLSSLIASKKFSWSDSKDETPIYYSSDG